MTEDSSKSTQSEAGLADDPAPAISEDGVDLTLIRWMLSMTPAERLETLEQTIRSILRLRSGEIET